MRLQSLLSVCIMGALCCSSAGVEAVVPGPVTKGSGHSNKNPRGQAFTAVGVQATGATKVAGGQAGSKLSYAAAAQRGQPTGGEGAAGHVAAGAAAFAKVLPPHSQSPFATAIIDPKWPRINGKVVHVADGDTVEIQTKDGRRQRIRMAFCDAPESKQEYGPEGGAALKSKVQGELVTVHVVTTDIYDRTVGVVVKDNTGEDINLSQILTGDAWNYAYYSKQQPPKMRQAYADAEVYARKRRLGLWSAASEPLNPRQWRLQNPRDDAPQRR